jgi:hypothetical protein
MKTLTSYCALLLLAGCLDRWTRTGVTEQQAEFDFYQCKRESSNINDSSGVGANGDFAQEEMIRQCMRSRGYEIE